MTNFIFTLGKERLVKEEKIDFSKKEDEKWKRRSLPAGKVQGTLILRNWFRLAASYRALKLIGNILKGEMFHHPDENVFTQNTPERCDNFGNGK